MAMAIVWSSLARKDFTVLQVGEIELHRVFVVS